MWKKLTIPVVKRQEKKRGSPHILLFIGSRTPSPSSLAFKNFPFFAIFFVFFYPLPYYPYAVGTEEGKNKIFTPHPERQPPNSDKSPYPPIHPA